MLYRRKPLVFNCFQFQWKDGEGIPDIPGVKFDLWREVTEGHGKGKMAPAVSTAYVKTPHGRCPIVRGDWILRDEAGELFVCADNIFRLHYEPLPVEGR